MKMTINLSYINQVNFMNYVKGICKNERKALEFKKFI